MPVVDSNDEYFELNGISLLETCPRGFPDPPVKTVAKNFDVLVRTIDEPPTGPFCNVALVLELAEPISTLAIANDVLVPLVIDTPAVENLSSKELSPWLLVAIPVGASPVPKPFDIDVLSLSVLTPCVEEA